MLYPGGGAQSVVNGLQDWINAAPVGQFCAGVVTLPGHSCEAEFQNLDVGTERGCKGCLACASCARPQPKNTSAKPELSARSTHSANLDRRRCHLGCLSVVSVTALEAMSSSPSAAADTKEKPTVSPSLLQ